MVPAIPTTHYCLQAEGESRVIIVRLPSLLLLCTEEGANSDVW